MTTTNVTKEQIAQAHADLASHRAMHPTRAIDLATIEQAMDPGNEYFVTTSEYWDCECEQDYIRPRSQEHCALCGADREEAPDSRIGEMPYRHDAEHWLSATAGLSEHNAAYRR